MTERVLVCLGGLVLALQIAACEGEPSSTFISPILQIPCKSDQCSANGVCSADAHGDGVCVCAVGYGGAGCERCEEGFHRDARARCVSDQGCAEQASDPCAPHGSCAESDGVLTCTCETEYQGPRCNLCADALAWSGRSLCEPVVPERADAAVVLDAGRADAGRDTSESDAGDLDAGPPDAELPDAGISDAGISDAGPQDAGSADAGTPDAGPRDAGTPDSGLPDAGSRDGGTLDACVTSTLTESFELAGFPDPPNSCAASSSLTVANLAFRSLQGEGTVQRCAPSSFNGLTTHYVELEAGPTHDAQITLTHTTSAITFKIAASLDPLSLDLFGDGKPLQTLSVPRLSNTTVTLSPNPGVTQISFRSRTLYIQRLGLDDITYTTVGCN